MPCTQPTGFEARHPLAKQTFYFLSLPVAFSCPRHEVGQGLALVLTFSGQAVGTSWNHSRRARILRAVCTGDSGTPNL